MVIAVAPYPVGGLLFDSEATHRVHNVVGAVQYLPLWALPVLAFALDRDRLDAWRLALISSLAMAAVGVWSGDLWPSLSWMPLATLLPLTPSSRLGPTAPAWWRPDRPRTVAIAAAVIAVVVAWRHAPTFVGYQRLDLTDSHSVRFHFSGMAAALMATAAAAVVVALYRSGRLVSRATAGAASTAGVVSLAWPAVDSALPAVDAAAMLVAAALVLGLDAAPTAWRPRASRRRAVTPQGSSNVSHLPPATTE